jgi:hypothetical protein
VQLFSLWDLSPEPRLLGRQLQYNLLHVLHLASFEHGLLVPDGVLLPLRDLPVLLWLLQVLRLRV